MSNIRTLADLNRGSAAGGQRSSSDVPGAASAPGGGGGEPQSIGQACKNCFNLLFPDFSVKTLTYLYFCVLSFALLAEYLVWQT